MVLGGVGFDNAAQLDVIDLPLSSPEHPSPSSSEPNPLLVKLILQWGWPYCVCVCVCTCECTSFNTFPQVTNHRVSDKATVVYGLTRSTWAGNHRRYWKCAFNSEKNKWRKWELERRWCLLCHVRGGGWQSIGFATVTIDLKRNTSLWCRLSPRSTRDWRPSVALSWMPNRVMAQCLPLHGISITFRRVMLDQRGTETNSMSDMVLD